MPKTVTLAPRNSGLDGPLTSLAALLRKWLPRQRWFGGKDSPVEDLSIGTATELRAGDPGLYHLILDVRQNGATDRYQLLLGVRLVAVEAGGRPGVQVGEVGSTTEPQGVRDRRRGHGTSLLATVQPWTCR